MTPQSTLHDFEPDLSELTEAEREVYEAVDLGRWGARPYAQHTDRSPGTISNLLRRAREKVEGSA